MNRIIILALTLASLATVAESESLNDGSNQRVESSNQAQTSYQQAAPYSQQTNVGGKNSYSQPGYSDQRSTDYSSKSYQQNSNSANQNLGSSPSNNNYAFRQTNNSPNKNPTPAQQQPIYAQPSANMKPASYQSPNASRFVSDSQKVPAYAQQNNYEMGQQSYYSPRREDSSYRTAQDQASSYELEQQRRPSLFRNSFKKVLGYAEKKMRQRLVKTPTGFVFYTSSRHNPNLGSYDVDNIASNSFNSRQQIEHTLQQEQVELQRLQKKFTDQQKLVQDLIQQQLQQQQFEGASKQARPSYERQMGSRRNREEFNI